MRKFKIQGKCDDEGFAEYWSNEQGWVDFKDATTFDDSEKINFPIGTEYIAWLDEQGYILLGEEYSEDLI